MKEEILKLRGEGKTYNEIKSILKCSKSTISYYCGDGQKEKFLNRTRKRRENNLLKKLDSFKYTKSKEIKPTDNSDTIKNLNRNIWRFNKTEISDNGRSTNINNEFNFKWRDVLKFYTENTNCYLSGVDINLFKGEYSFDHIIPVSKGGKNTFDNLGIAHSVVNQMKSDLSVDELIIWCVRILEHNGYNVNKI